MIESIHDASHRELRSALADPATRPSECVLIEREIAARIEALAAGMAAREPSSHTHTGMMSSYHGGGISLNYCTCGALRRVDGPECRSAADHPWSAPNKAEALRVARQLATWELDRA